MAVSVNFLVHSLRALVVSAFINGNNTFQLNGPITKVDNFSLFITTRKPHFSTKKQIKGLAFHLIFSHRYSPFNCFLSVVFLRDKGDYAENWHVEFCPNNNKKAETKMIASVLKQDSFKRWTGKQQKNR